MYFDLNERSSPSAGAPLPDGTPDPNPNPGMPWWEQGLMYLFIVLGVLFAPLMNLLAKGTALPAEVVNPGILVGAAVVGFFVIPTIWEKVGAKRDAPLIVRLAVFFQNGVFWQSLLGTIFAAAT